MSTITFDFRHHYVRGERRESEQIAYQWDLGHVMNVFVPEDATYTIGYCFGDYEKTEDYAIDTKVQDPDGGYKLTAHIPNKYFERSRELRVYVVGSADDHIITTYEGFITIRGRLQPDDYVDDDPENGATHIIEEAQKYATKSQSYSVGGTGTREGEDTDNAKYYLEEAQRVADSIPEDYSELSDDVDQLKNALSDAETAINAMEIVDNASGAIASFADGSNGVPVKGLKVPMEPVQDLHGYDNPWPGGSGKNLFQTTMESQTVRDVTFTVNSDGSITVSGTPSALINNKNFGIVTIPAGTYKANGFSSGSSSGIRMVVYNDTASSTIAIIYEGLDIEFTLSAESNIRIYPIIPSSFTGTVTFYPMIRLASDTDSSYAPYSNVCPISGRSSITVTRAGANLVPLNSDTFVSFSGSCTLSDGVITSGSGTSRTGVVFKAKPNTTYTVGYRKTAGGVSYANIYVYKSYPETIDQEGRRTIDTAAVNDSTASLSYTITTASDENYIYLGMYKSANPAAFSMTDFYVRLDGVAEYEPYNGQQVTIQLGQTVYGGTLDVTNGVLTVDKAIITLDENTPFSGISADSHTFFVDDVLPEGNANRTSSTSPKFLCNQYKEANSISNTSQAANKESGTFFNQNTFLRRIIIKNNNYSTAQSFAESLEGNNIQIVCPLPTALTYQCSPTEVRSLLGVNNIWADTGDSAVDYVADTKLYIEQLTEPDADMVADMNITSGNYFMVGNTLYLATANIANGAAIVVGVNCTRTSLAEALNAINS